VSDHALLHLYCVNKTKSLTETYLRYFKSNFSWLQQLIASTTEWDEAFKTWIYEW